MAHPVTMPRQGWTMETGSVVEWLKRPGEFVRQGEQLMVIQSDKAANEIEALESGYLDIPSDAPAVGAEVPIGTLLAYLLTEAEARERGLHIPNPSPGKSPLPIPSPVATGEGRGRAPAPCPIPRSDAGEG